MPIEAVTYASARDVDLGQWRRLSAGVDVRLDPTWLAVIEHAVVRAEPLYLGLWREGSLLAVAPCLLGLEDDSGFATYRATDALLRPEEVRGPDEPGLDRAEVNRVAPALSALRPLRTLTVVAPFSRYAAVSALVWPGADAAERLVAEFDALATDRGAALWAILGVAEGSPLLGAAERLGLRPALLSADTALSVRWSSVEDYVLSLPSDRRTAVRRELRAPVAQGYTIAPEPDVGAIVDDLDRLVALQRARYGRRGGRLPLGEIVGAFGEDAQLLGARRDGDLMAYTLLVGRGEVNQVFGYAADHDLRRQEDFLWPNMAVYAPIAQIVDRGGGRLRWGPMNYPAKLLRGPELEPMWGLYRPLTPALESALDRYLPPFNHLQREHFASLARFIG